MKKKVSVDRIEEGIIVFVDENKETYDLSSDVTSLALCEGDICLLELDNAGGFLSVEKIEKEAEAKRAELSSRLSRLFKNKK